MAQSGFGGIEKLGFLGLAEEFFYIYTASPGSVLGVQ